MTDYIATKDTVLRLLTEIQAVLAREHEQNWINGINGLISMAEQRVQTHDEARLLLREISSSYRSMTGGAGSFSDYYVHRDSREELIRQNDMFDRLRAELWRHLWDAV